MNYQLAVSTKTYALTTAVEAVYLPLPELIRGKPFYAHSLHMYFNAAYAVANSVLVSVSADPAGDYTLVPPVNCEFTYGESTATAASAIAVLEIPCPLPTSGVYLHVQLANATATLTAAYLAVS